MTQKPLSFNEQKELFIVCLRHPEYDSPPFTGQTCKDNWTLLVISLTFDVLTSKLISDRPIKGHLWYNDDCNARTYWICFRDEMSVVCCLQIIDSSKHKVEEKTDISPVDEIFTSRQPLKTWCVVTQLDGMTTPATSLPHISPARGGSRQKGKRNYTIRAGASVTLKSRRKW